MMIRKKERGQSLVEYAILVVLLAVAAIATVQYFGATLRDQFAVITTELAGGDSSAAQADATSTSAKAGTEAKTAHTMGTSGGNAGKN